MPEAKRWVRLAVDEDRAQRLAGAARIGRRTARLLVARGIDTPEAAARFLAPALAHLPDPSLLKGLDRAVLRVAEAIKNAEKIALYGDYDVDGVTSTSLLASFFRLHGVDVRTYIPKRLVEGYGLNHQAVLELAGEGVKVLITLDCGITAADEIRRAGEHGIETIVVDHHRCPPELPPAYAVLNPHQDGCPYPDKGLAAVGVAMNLAIGLRRHLRAIGFYAGREEPNLMRLLDLVALGTIADMVPLVGANRVFTWFGLKELRAGHRPGVRALLEVAGVAPGRCTGADVGFRLGPRINAAGRLDDASVGVKMLLAASIDEARPHAAVLDDANASRKNLEAQVFREAVARIDADGEPKAANVLYDPAWHPGVIGIVASKLVERYGRPAILVGDGGRGSARTARDIHIYDALAKVSHHLVKFGGHKAAAGFTVTPEAFPAFAAALVDEIAADPRSLSQGVELTYDDELAPDEVDFALLEEVERLSPFGVGNPEPLFRTGVAHVRSARVVGKSHLKLRLAEGKQGGLEAIAFHRGELCPSLPTGRPLDLAFHLERNEFSGVALLGLRVRDLCPL